MAEDRTVDQDVAEDVELAEKGPDFERRVGEVAAPRRPAAPQVAAEDVYIGEVDEDGHGSGVRVNAGDPIPPELAGLPRHPARAGWQPPRKRK